MFQICKVYTGFYAMDACALDVCFVVVTLEVVVGPENQNVINMRLFWKLFGSS